MIAAAYEEKGSRNSRIQIRLDAGTYFIEATTYNANAVGAYTLSLMPTPPASSISLGQQVSGTLTAASRGSVRSGSYADRYQFVLNETTEVRIDMTSTAFETEGSLWNACG